MNRAPLFISAALVAVLLGGCAEPPRNDFLVGPDCKANACRATAGLPMLRAGRLWGEQTHFGGRPFQDPLKHPVAPEQRKRVAACLQTCAPDYAEIAQYLKNPYIDLNSDDGFRIACALDPAIRSLPHATLMGGQQ